jgi:secretion/DNA translocation related CpaE-like protein
LISDDDLLDDVLRLAAAASCEVHRAADEVAARATWTSAPLVIIDEPAAERCARLQLPRREGVIVVVRGEPSAPVWEHAMSAGAQHVVSLPQAEPWLVGALSDASEGRRRQGSVLAVVGGRGGAGASVLAAAVAVRAAADGDPVLLVDCDPLGGGLDLVLGAEDAAGPRWPELALGGGRVPAASLRAALPAPPVGMTALGDRLVSLASCGRSGDGPLPDALRAVVDAGRRAGELVVCDLPRHLTEAALIVAEAADLVALVVPAEVRSCAAAARVAAILAERGATLGLVVRGPAPGGLSADDVARTLELPLITVMRPQPGLARMLDQGRPPGRSRGPLASAARELLAALGAPAGPSPLRALT